MPALIHCVAATYGKPVGQWEWPLTSLRRAAILELMDEVPQRETFHQADVLMEGLSNLSPRRLHTLLVACRNVKVKRLFLWFAERHQHAWLKKAGPEGYRPGARKTDACARRQADPTFTSLCRSLSMPVVRLSQQAALLVRTVPLVAAETCFAAQRRDGDQPVPARQPRLSFDIDLTYVPVADRASSLKEIDAAMKRIADAITRAAPRRTCERKRAKGREGITKLIVRDDTAQIKVEATPVLRGCVYEPAVRSVSTRVEEEFGFAEMPVVSFADLYAGKVVAALDRQHPRDLFDVHELLSHEGIDDTLRKAFIRLSSEPPSPDGGGPCTGTARYLGRIQTRPRPFTQFVGFDANNDGNPVTDRVGTSAGTLMRATICARGISSFRTIYFRVSATSCSSPSTV